ncbi:MAG TPA: redoxin domain-containing protein, partial [Vicinamibacteria bacterium]|nr:redoxin domain-containing protein [Vicinamibacteria bacterium]
MELERSLERFESQGLGVAAISYDSPEILAHFSARMGGFHFPLLADPQSTIIKAFGVLNRNVEEGHPFFGMARPVTFVVDADGMVTSKFFEPGHRQRMTADSILVREFGVGGGKRTEIQGKHMKLVTYPAQDVVRRGNRVTLVMEVELPEKMHLYAPGVEG